MIAIHGSFELTVTDTETAEKYVLDEPTTGLHIPTGTWTELKSFSGDAVGLVIASREYDPDDYIHDFEELSQYTG